MFLQCGIEKKYLFCEVTKLSYNNHSPLLMLKLLMLTKDQKNYLNKIPANKKVKIFPFNKKVTKTADEIIDAIKNIYPNLKLIHMGTSALKISGQNDIDIYAFSDPSNFDKYLPGLTKLFGEPLGEHNTFIEWNFDKNGFEVEFYLTAPDSETMMQQITVFKTLKANKKLLKEYETLKSSMNGQSFRDYQRKKYEFYNKLLKQSTS